MKKMTLLKSMVAIALFMVAGMSAFAQVTANGSLSMVAPAGANANDTVTVGSVMPYRVTGDIQMHQLRVLGVLNYSQFSKVVSAGGTLRAATGAAASTPAATDSAWSVLWTAVGGQTIDVTELPQVVSGPAYCAANTQTLNVVVVNRPTAVWNGAASASGCNVAGTAVTIPYTVAGTGQFEVKYRITFTPLSGAPSNVVATGTTLTVGSYQTAPANLNFTYNVPAAAYGKYDVYIENVADRIAIKSFGAAYASQAADIPAAATTFYAYPTPVTAPINHIQNL